MTEHTTSYHSQTYRTYLNMV